MFQSPLSKFFLYHTALFFFRVRQLRQSRVGASCHPGHERLPDRDEEAEGSAEALEERQQTLLILATGPSPLPSSNASTARVSSPSSQGHHSRDSVGQRGTGAHHRRETPSESLKKKINCNDLYTFYCIAFLWFCHVILSRLKYFNVYDYL